MGRLLLLTSFVAALAICLIAPSFANETDSGRKMNAVTYFEIPVTDMERATRFYEAVFELDLERQKIDGYDMALFPFAPDAPGATGALAKGDVYVPAKAGPVVYFGVDDIEALLSRALASGGKVLYPKKDVGQFGFVAEFEDSEGNRIAVHSKR
jgi:uncharacterized protein